jgi:hypothetical protein
MTYAGVGRQITATNDLVTATVFDALASRPDIQPVEVRFSGSITMAGWLRHRDSIA